MSLKISVITICFNNPEDVITTCKSVDQQTRKPDEHLIVDGSENQVILHYLESHPQPGFRKWKNEPDEGISDAFNKGILRASGDIIHLLNSGDYYYDDTVLQRAGKTFEANPGVKWTSGKYLQYRGNTWIESGVPFEKKKLYRGMRQVAHPTMFVKKELYDRHGLYDLDVEVAMDYDFMVRIRNEKYLFINYPLVCFAPGGKSEIEFGTGIKNIKHSYRKYIGRSAKLNLWMLWQRTLPIIMGTTLGRLLFRIKNRQKIQRPPKG
ncbi:MAG: glycosyltransferase [Bacteroidia bacterium]